MNLASRTSVVLLTASGMACGGSSLATVVPDPPPPALAPPERTMQPPRRRVPGFTVPGSQIGMPDRARAGSVVEGIAPAGSRIEAADQVLEIGEDRRFRLRIPADAQGALPVRVIRPDGRVLVLRVEIIER